VCSYFLCEAAGLPKQHVFASAGFPGHTLTNNYTSFVIVTISYSLKWIIVSYVEYVLKHVQEKKREKERKENIMAFAAYPAMCRI